MSFLLREIFILGVLIVMKAPLSGNWISFVRVKFFFFIADYAILDQSYLNIYLKIPE